MNHTINSPSVATSDFVLEGFGGPGGWSEGLRAAGFAGSAVGVELDAAACRTATAAGHVRVRADVAAFPLDHLAGAVDGVMRSNYGTGGDAQDRGERTPDQPASRWPLSAWEPVLYSGGRPADPSRVDERRNVGREGRRVDSLVHGVSPMTTLPGRVIGAKPAAFCRWLFDLLGAAPGDMFDDLFPGSGAVTRAWRTYTAHTAPAPQASDPDLADTSREVLHDTSGPADHDASCPHPSVVDTRHIPTPPTEQALTAEDRRPA